MIERLVKGSLASTCEIAKKVNELVDWANALQERFDEVKADREKSRKSEESTPLEELKVGDKVWVEYAFNWYKGKIVAFAAKQALVEISFGKSRSEVVGRMTSNLGRIEE